ncbi:hypothetical protein V8F20_005671 [Naviculisporaceae sp. PSN 640]
MGSVTPDSDFKVTIPVIDISGYLAGDASATESVVSALHSAARSPGFFQIVGHNVTSELRNRLLTTLKAFFALPADRKKRLHRGNSNSLRGYESVGEQRLEAAFADQKEGFMIGAELPDGKRFLQGPNQWPEEDECPGFRETFMEYFGELRQLSKLMFRLMALGLKLEETYFDDFVDSRDSVTMCRAHRYPPTTPEQAGKTRGIGAHSDFGALTLLMQDDIGGLEVFHRPTETWHPVAPVPDAFVVNIGDMMERWTNNRYTSTLHRVITPASTRDRYSVAFFNEGLLDQVIECIPTCLEPGEKPLYEPVVVEEHLAKRYGNSY